jgi:DNA-binding transcriptional ArsR family regulator
MESVILAPNSCRRGPREPMEFRIVLAERPTPLDSKNLDDALVDFLKQIEYIPKGFNPKNGAKNTEDSIPYRMFKDCLLMRPDRVWTIPQLAAALDTSKPTVYRHLNKLKSLGFIEESKFEEKADNGSVMLKAHRLRYGDILKAWGYVEENIHDVMGAYRKSVSRIRDLAGRKR